MALVERPRILATLAPDAKRFEMSRSLAQYIQQQLDRPTLEIPMARRKLSASECWSVLPLLWSVLNAKRKKGEFPADVAREFFEADIVQLVNPKYEEVMREISLWTVYFSRFEKTLSWIERKFEPEKRRLELIVHAEAPREREFTVDDAARLAYQAGIDLGDNIFRWMTVPPDFVGLPYEHPPVGIYLQKHALDRTFERLSVPHQSTTHLLMTGALWEATFKRSRIKVRRDGSVWVKFRIHAGTLGYFVGSVVDGCLLLRTFLFVTMEGTREHEVLKRRLHIHRRDIEFMKLDDMATFLKSDVGDDPELVAILRECGLGHLLKLRKEVSGDVETGRASFMRMYLGLPQTPAESPQRQAPQPDPDSADEPPRLAAAA
jgi:hypothetical protein